MKKTFFYACLFIVMSIKADAQIEIKIQPLAIIAKSVSIGMEYGLKPHFGVELEYQYASKLTGTLQSQYKANALWLGAKKYFNKDILLSKFYAGGYSSYMKGQFAYTSSSVKHIEQLSMFSLGATGGYKAVKMKNHLILEVGLNLGKRFSYINGRLIDDTYFDKEQIKFFYYWDISLRLLVGYRF